ncbi:site-specific integrase [Clostridium botulinum]|nr:site-specific integrase [Clostridium botulinum]
MKNIIENYIKDLQKKNLSKNTLEAYRRDVEKFSKFVRNREERILSVDTVTIMAFVQYLQREGRATSSIVRNIVSVRNFYKYLIKKQWYLRILH